MSNPPKLTPAQLGMLRTLDGGTRPFIAYYKPSAILVNYGLAAIVGKFQSVLEITEAGREYLRAIDATPTSGAAARSDDG